MSTPREVMCPCGSVAYCVEDEDDCLRGNCRGCGQAVISCPEGVEPTQPRTCESCED